jgi:HlyD family secretion protein
LQAPVLFSIAEDLKQMEVQVDVDEADVGKVTLGQTATFSVDAYPNRTFPARIRELRFAAEIVQGVVTYKAILTVDNSELLLRPGMTATAQITVHEVENALLVPNAALRFSPTGEESAAPGFLKRLLPGMPQFRAPSPREEIGPARQVWVVRDGAPAAVAVVVGATDGNHTEILEGAIEPGQAVIVDFVTAIAR